MERLENSEETQQLRRRALPADASQSTTPAFSHSHTLGLPGSETSPKTRESCSDEPTPNSYHDNGSRNNSTALSTARREKEPLRTAFDLREAIYPPPRRHSRSRKRRRLLDHFPDVVRFVWDSRHADRSQIQRRFPAQMGTERTAQDQLDTLVNVFGYLGILVIRGHATRNHYVFFATKKGLRFLDEHDAAIDA